MTLFTLGLFSKGAIFIFRNCISQDYCEAHINQSFAKKCSILGALWHYNEELLETVFKFIRPRNSLDESLIRGSLILS